MTREDRGIEDGTASETTQGSHANKRADLPREPTIAPQLNRDRLGNFRGLSGFAFGLLDVDAALEEGAVFDADALCNDIPSQGTFTADVYPRGR
jgi:hypothetical protein